MPKKKDDERLEIHIPRREKRRLAQPVRYVFTDVPEGKAFLTLDGRRLRNLLELADALDHMDERVFRHHANGERNDFSNWIRDVMGEQALADSVRGKDLRGVQIEVLKHIVKQLKR